MNFKVKPQSTKKSKQQFHAQVSIYKCRGNISMNVQDNQVRQAIIKLSWTRTLFSISKNKIWIILSQILVHDSSKWALLITPKM